MMCPLSVFVTTQEVKYPSRTTNPPRLSLPLAEFERSFTLPCICKGSSRGSQEEEWLALRDHDKAAASDFRKPPCAVLRDGIEFGDKDRGEAAIAVRRQGDLAWLVGNAVRKGQLVAIGGGKDEIRRTGKFGRQGPRITQDLEVTLTVVFSQLGRRPDCPVRCRRAWSERYPVRCQATARDFEGFCLCFRCLTGDGRNCHQCDYEDGELVEPSAAKHEGTPGSLLSLGQSFAARPGRRVATETNKKRRRCHPLSEVGSHDHVP